MLRVARFLVPAAILLAPVAATAATGDEDLCGTQAIVLKPDEAEYYNTRGLTYRQLHDTDKALTDFDQAIKLKPDFAAAFNNRGIVYCDLKQPGRAIAYYRQAITLAPNYALAYYNLGETENDAQGDYDKAITDLTTALKLNPQLVPARLNRGIAYARNKNTGDRSGGDADIAAARKLDPDLSRTMKKLIGEI